MQGAGFTDTRVQGEELLANWFGWFNRTLEASAHHDDIPMPWFQYAFRGYLALQKRRPRAARAAAAAAGLLQPDDRGAQAVSVDVARARADTPGRRVASPTSTTPAPRCRPRPVLDAVIEHLRREAEIGGYEAAAERADRVEHTYDAIARLIGAQPRRDRDRRERHARVGHGVLLAHAAGRATASSPRSAEYASNYIADAAGRRPHRRRGRGRARRRARPGRRRRASRAMLDERVKLVSLVHVPTPGRARQPRRRGRRRLPRGRRAAAARRLPVGRADAGRRRRDRLRHALRHRAQVPARPARHRLPLRPPRADRGARAAAARPPRRRVAARRLLRASAPTPAASRTGRRTSRPRSGSASRPTTRSSSGLEAIRDARRARWPATCARGSPRCPASTVHDLGEELRRDRHLHGRRPPDRRRWSTRCARPGVNTSLSPATYARLDFGPRGLDRPRARVAALLQRPRRPRPPGRRRRERSRRRRPRAREAEAALAAVLGDVHRDVGVAHERRPPPPPPAASTTARSRRPAASSPTPTSPARPCSSAAASSSASATPRCRTLQERGAIRPELDRRPPPLRPAPPGRAGSGRRALLQLEHVPRRLAADLRVAVRVGRVAAQAAPAGRLVADHLARVLARGEGRRRPARRAPARRSRSGRTRSGGRGRPSGRRARGSARGRRPACRSRARGAR